MAKHKRKVSAFKTFTWRIVASTDTFLIGWLISGSPTIGVSIASIEIITKLFLYYWHERIWENHAKRV